MEIKQTKILHLKDNGFSNCKQYLSDQETKNSSLILTANEDIQEKLQQRG